MTFHDNREHYSLVHIRKQCPSFPFFPSTFLSISKLTKLFLKHKNRGFNVKLSRTQQSKGIWSGEWKTNSESHNISRYSTQYIFFGYNNYKATHWSLFILWHSINFQLTISSFPEKSKLLVLPEQPCRAYTILNIPLVHMAITPNMFAFWGSESKPSSWWL